MGEASALAVRGRHFRSWYLCRCGLVALFSRITSPSHVESFYRPAGWGASVVDVGSMSWHRSLHRYRYCRSLWSQPRTLVTSPRRNIMARRPPRRLRLVAYGALARTLAMVARLQARRRLNCRPRHAGAQHTREAPVADRRLGRLNCGRKASFVRRILFERSSRVDCKAIRLLSPAGPTGSSLSSVKGGRETRVHVGSQLC